MVCQIFYLYLFTERGTGRERNTSMCERYIGWLPHLPPVGDLVCNPGVFPDWELNQRPFGSQAGTQSTEPHRPGQADHNL